MLWTLAGLFVAAVVLELVVRITVGAPRPDLLPAIRVEPDPELGYRPVPRDEHYGYDVEVVLNGMGMRGPDPAPKQTDEFVT